MKYSLCCISNILQEKGYKFQTMTKKSFLKDSRKNSTVKLSKKILNNFTVTKEILNLCGTKGWNYRLSSSLCPLLTLKDLNLSFDSLPDLDAIESIITDSRKIIEKYQIRVSTHPDQFNVLCNGDPDVRDRTIRELNFQSKIMDKYGLAANYNFPMNLHINNSSDSPANLSKILRNNLDLLDNNAKSRLVFENEDKGIWNVETLYTYVFKEFNIPITFDYLHHKCNPGNLSEEQAFLKSHETWKDIKPLFHYSESDPKEKNKRKHANIPLFKLNDYSKEFDVEFEFKNKDFAIIHYGKI